MGEMGEMWEFELREQGERQTEGLGKRETVPKICVCRQQEGTS